MCDCKSAIRPDTGTTRAEVLYQAEYFPDTKHPRVSVDACIAHWVERLWMGGVRTRASCCGHDGLFGPPTVFVDSAADVADACLILDADSREWHVIVWAGRGNYSGHKVRKGK